MTDNNHRASPGGGHNYSGWMGAPGHGHDRPHDPRHTASFNQQVFEAEEKARLAKEAALARAAQKRQERETAQQEEVAR